MKRLIYKLSVFSFSNLAFAVSQWLVLIIVAKWLTPADLGVFSFALAVINPLNLLMNLNLRAMQATDVRKQHRFRDYLRLRIICQGISLAIAVVICVVAGFDRQTATILFFIYLYKFFDSLSDVIYGRMQQEGRFDQIAFSRMSQSLTQILLFAAAVYWTRDIVMGAVALVLAYAATALFYDLPRVIALGRVAMMQPPEVAAAPLSPNYYALAFKALPLGLTQFLDALMFNIPRYSIEGQLGAEKLGYYSAIASCIFIGNIFITSLAEFSRTTLAKIYLQDQAKFRKYTFALAGLGLAIGLISVVASYLVGGTVLTLLFNEEYAQYKDLLTIMMIMSTFWFSASFIGVGITATRAFSSQLPLYVISCLITFGVAKATVPSYGLAGAGWALVLGMVARFVGSHVVFMRLTSHGVRPELMLNT